MVRVRPPTTASFSNTVTRTPEEASSMAAAKPPGPAPITATWGRVFESEGGDAFIRQSVFTA